MKILMIMALSVITLAACNSSSNNNDDNNNGNGSGTGATNNQLKVFAAQTANDEPKIIENVDSIKNDINTLFKGAEPVKVEAGDSVQDVINRAGG